MATTDRVSATAPLADDNSQRGWQIAWGVLLIVVGFLAVLLPGAAALATAVLFAWLLILGGGFEIAYAIQSRQRSGFGWKLVSGLLTLALGIVLLVLPTASVLSLALLIGAFLLASGITRVILAFKVRPRRGWGWVLADGLVSIALAVLIAIGWPASSIAVIGVLVGFSLISTGIWRLMLRNGQAVGPVR